MAVHYLSQGNLVTHKETTWQFGLAPDLALPEAGVNVRWSWGTPYGDDTDEPPAPPTAWVDAGAGPISQPIKFATAAPHIVRATVAIQLETLEELADGEPLPETGLELDDPTDRTTFERSCVVYPGRLEIVEGPAYLAWRTKGYLPVMFHFLGLGPKVRIRDQLRYTLSISSRPGMSPTPWKVTEDTDRFVHVPAGDIDRPASTRQNGNGHTYNVYLAPRVIRRIGQTGPAAVRRGPHSVDLSLAAYPAAEDRAKAVDLSEQFREIEYYIDERPYLLHIESPSVGPEVYSMAGDSSRVQPAKRFLRTLHGGGKATDYPIRGWRVPPGGQMSFFVVVRGQPPSLATVRYEDRSDPNGLNVDLDVAVVDRNGIWYDDHTHCRVEGARRGAAAVTYYKLTKPLTSVLDGPRCLIGTNAPMTGQFEASVFESLSRADVRIAGLEDSGKSFDYAGVVSTVLGLGAAIAGFAAGAGVKIAGVAVAPWVVVPLAVANAVANAWWAYTPPAPELPYTDAEVQIYSSAALLGITGRLKAAGNQTVESRTVSRSTNTSTRQAFEQLDATFNVNTIVAVSDEVRISQAYAAHVLQREGEPLATEARIQKGGFDQALRMKVNG